MNDDSLVTAENWMVILNNALYTAIDFNTQLILVSVLNIQIFLASIYVFLMKLYRCWIMWRQPLVMVIPCILSLAFLGANLQTITNFQTNFAS